MRDGQAELTVSCVCAAAAADTDDDVDGDNPVYLMSEYLVVCAWRSIKEVSLLLGQLTSAAPVIVPNQVSDPGNEVTDPDIKVIHSDRSAADTNDGLLTVDLVSKCCTRSVL